VLLRFFDFQFRYAKLAFELGQFVEIYRTDDVDDSELLRVSDQHCKTANLVTVEEQMDLDVSLFFARDVHHSRPAWTTKLRPNRLEVSRCILTFRIKLEALDVNAFQSCDQLLYFSLISIFVGENAGSYLHQPPIDIDIDGLVSFSGEMIQT